MPQEIIVNIGYDYYAMAPEDFAALCEISKVSVKVHQPDYTKPWVVDPTGGLIITNVSFSDCDLTPLPEPEAQPNAASEGIEIPARRPEPAPKASLDYADPF